MSPATAASVRTPAHEFDRKRDLILDSELAFTRAIGAKVFEKPRVSFWMILIPILFLYFVYRMQRYKRGRIKFNDDFMMTRRRALDTALAAVETGRAPQTDDLVRQAGLSDKLAPAYGRWVRTLVEYYTDLLKAQGDSFEALVRSAFRNRTEHLLVLNRLSAVEKDFYQALRPHLAVTEGAADIVTVIEEQSRILRREQAEQIFS